MSAWQMELYPASQSAASQQSHETDRAANMMAQQRIVNEIWWIDMQTIQRVNDAIAAMPTTRPVATQHLDDAIRACDKLSAIIDDMIGITDKQIAAIDRARAELRAATQPSGMSCELELRMAHRQAAEAVQEAQRLKVAADVEAKHGTWGWVIAAIWAVLTMLSASNNMDLRRHLKELRGIV